MWTPFTNPRILLLALLAACKTAATDVELTPFQGPRNASFEEAQGAAASFAASWEGEGSIAPNCANYGSGNTAVLERITGSAFMPTQGTHYIRFRNHNMSVWMYQDNVDLTRSSRMLFDYSIAGGGEFASPTGTTIEILFTSNGTVALWSRHAPPGLPFPATEKQNEVIELPITTTPGRLMIRLTMSCGNTSVGNGHFYIDNIRVE
jgi:hypothetical protein